MSKPIKLIIQSPDDIPIVSSLVQDAALRVADMMFDAGEHRFVLVCNRYAWERKRWWQRRGERVRTALHFNGVMQAATHNIDLADKDTVVSLLAVTCAADGEDFTITLSFADDRAVKLKAECVDGLITDLSEPWEALSAPDHTKDFDTDEAFS